MADTVKEVAIIPILQELVLERKLISLPSIMEPNKQGTLRSSECRKNLAMIAK